MSEFLDELARTLVTPMPRRRALSMLGGALVTATVPAALRPRPARGGTRRPAVATGLCQKNCSAPSPVPCICPGPDPKYCFETCGVAGSTCCCLKNSAGQSVGAVACPPGTRCGRPGESNCPATCKTKLCGPAKKCCARDEECVQFRVDLVGGKTYEGCLPKCERGSRRCKGSSTCCPNAQHCCDHGLCCGPEQVCVRALNTGNQSARLCVRKCKAPQARCNFICCDSDKRAYRKLPDGRIRCHCVQD